jgi:hypothetical protein
LNDNDRFSEADRMRLETNIHYIMFRPHHWCMEFPASKGVIRIQKMPSAGADLTCLHVTFLAADGSARDVELTDEFKLRFCLCVFQSAAEFTQLVYYYHDLAWTPCTPQLSKEIREMVDELCLVEAPYATRCIRKGGDVVVDARLSNDIITVKFLTADGEAWRAHKIGYPFPCAKALVFSLYQVAMAGATGKRKLDECD